MRLKPLGAIAFNTWNQIPEKYPHVELDYFIIMPNHLHGILILVNHPLILNVNSQQSFIKIAQSSSLQESQIRPKGSVSKSLSAVVGWYKSSVAKIINQICDNSG